MAGRRFTSSWGVQDYAKLQEKYQLAFVDHEMLAPWCVYDTDGEGAPVSEAPKQEVSNTVVVPKKSKKETSRAGKSASRQQSNGPSKRRRLQDLVLAERLKGEQIMIDSDVSFLLFLPGFASVAKELIEDVNTALKMGEEEAQLAVTQVIHLARKVDSMLF